MNHAGIHVVLAWEKGSSSFLWQPTNLHCGRSSWPVHAGRLPEKQTTRITVRYHFWLTWECAMVWMFSDSLAHPSCSFKIKKAMATTPFTCSSFQKALPIILWHLLQSGKMCFNHHGWLHTLITSFLPIFLFPSDMFIALTAKLLPKSRKCLHPYYFSFLLILCGQFGSAYQVRLWQC